jgi:hypothetical protein
MTKRVEPLPRYVILDANIAHFKRFLSKSVQLCRTQAEIARAYDEAADGRTWISFSQKWTDELLKAVAERQRTRQARSHPRQECVLTIAVPRPASVPTLHGLFANIVGDSPSYRWLPKDELSEVLFDASTDHSDFLIAAASDPFTRTLSLVRGDGRSIVVPFSFFEPSGDGTKPDFANIRITDFGRAVALGEYEASADAILYEMDRDYRKKARLKRKENETTFGAALCRLRKQRKLKRGDFPPLSAKTIARLERNEIGKPHGATLQAIATRLGVLPDEIGDY